MTDISYCRCGHQQKFHRGHIHDCIWFKCKCEWYVQAQNLETLVFLEKRRTWSSITALFITIFKFLIYKCGRAWIFTWDHFAPLIIIFGVIGFIAGLTTGIFYLFESDAKRQAKNVTVHCYSGSTTLYEGHVTRVVLYDGGVHIVDWNGNEYFCNGFVSNKDKEINNDNQKTSTR